MGMFRSVKHVVIVTLLGVSCISCAPNGSRSEVVGNYRANYGFGVEQLRLLNDGRYEQMFQLAGEATPKTHTGKWELKREDYLLVYLYDSLLVADNSGKLRPHYEDPVSGRRAMIVRKGLGKVYLDFNLDVGLSFEKQAR
jgi:hypothetical protein